MTCLLKFQSSEEAQMPRCHHVNDTDLYRLNGIVNPLWLVPLPPRE